MDAQNETFVPTQELPSRELFPDSQARKRTYVRLIAGLGALGVALQNYPAVVLFITGLTTGVVPVCMWLSWSTQIMALTTGGLCSFMVNFWMNEGLLNDFHKRMTSDEDYQYKALTRWERIQYFAGIFVFVVTGILFGLMAFTFAMTGPLATLSIAAGIFVAAIMTIQEVETWLASYDKAKKDKAKKAENAEPEVPMTLTHLQFLGKWIGHIIAVGNVLALSLLFTLGLAQSLMAIQVAAFPALLIGFAVAFTFGAFTEYFFYNAYLSEFCQNFGEKWDKMKAIPNAWLGLLSVVTNALVNGALTYAGVELLTGLLLAANIALPAMLAITILATVSAFFAGTASLILGLNFWIEQNWKEPLPTSYPVLSSVQENASIAHKRYGSFLRAANDPEGAKEAPLGLLGYSN